MTVKLSDYVLQNEYYSLPNGNLCKIYLPSIELSSNTRYYWVKIISTDDVEIVSEEVLQLLPNNKVAEILYGKSKV